jgi:hypothetical protein
MPTKPDGLVKSGSVPVYVIPAQAGIQSCQMVLAPSRRGRDGSGTFYKSIELEKNKSPAFRRIFNNSLKFNLEVPIPQMYRYFKKR